jgi:hypothetical protein
MERVKERNAARVVRADGALADYLGDEDSGETKRDALTDLLTDLRHWAAYEKEDFARSLALSQDHFREEVADAKAGL